MDRSLCQPFLPHNSSLFLLIPHLHPILISYRTTLQLNHFQITIIAAPKGAMLIPILNPQQTQGSVLPNSFIGLKVILCGHISSLSLQHRHYQAREERFWGEGASTTRPKKKKKKKKKKQQNKKKKRNNKTKNKILVARIDQRTTQPILEKYRRPLY